MPQADQPAPAPPITAKPTETRKTKATSPPEPRAPLFAFTIDSADGSVLTFERLNEAGERQTLTPEEKLRIAKAFAGPTLSGVVEEAFEAGIECVLGEGDEEEAGEKADDGLRRELLRSLIDRSRAKHLVEDNTLDRAIVGRLIAHATAH
jgi:hypothetical protein